MIESELRDLAVQVWAYRRDQPKDGRDIAHTSKEQVQRSVALAILLTPDSLAAGANQWMELAYADAFDVPSFYLLHGVTLDDLKAAGRGVPPLLFAADCIPAIEWRRILPDLRRCCQQAQGRP